MFGQRALAHPRQFDMLRGVKWSSGLRRSHAAALTAAGKA
jgi:hypothetical protein